MIKPIMKDIMFLSAKSLPATKEDKQVSVDLLDTLKAHSETCLGMAANMIGVNKRIIAVSFGPMQFIMYNPVITSKKKEYKATETCLSLSGERDCTRYEEIEVEYEDIDFKKNKKTFTGLTAQIIQHECDHLEGIII